MDLFGGDQGATGGSGPSPPWRIFISHTDELARHPAPLSFVAAAKRAIMDSGHLAVEMSGFEPEDSDPVAMCRRRVGECAIYLGIIGFRYGSPVGGREGPSFTEVEFDTATELGLERLVFLLDPRHTLGTHEWLADVTYGARQEAFRARLTDEAKLVTTSVTSPDELVSKIIRALVNLRDRWARAGPRPAPVPPRPPLRSRRPVEHFVERPELTERLSAALTADDTATVVVRGGGGVGKSTLAAVTADRPEIRARFPDGDLWVDIGPDLAGPRLAAKINEWATALAATDSPPADPRQAGLLPADPQQAGLRLGDLLGEHRFLLIIDDVWKAEQLEPFLAGGRNCRRLVTTRDRAVLPMDGVLIDVDVMEPEQAVLLLTEAVPGLDDDQAGLLARRCRFWPVLLRLVAGHLRGMLHDGRPLAGAVVEVIDGLDEDGLAAFDDSTRRERQVKATVEASLRLLGQTDAFGDGALERFRDLAAFRRGATIPRHLLEALWRHTAGWSRLQTIRFCQRLTDLSLVLAVPGDEGGVLLHDVMHEYLQRQLGARLPEVHARLVAACGGSLPVEDGQPAWWLLPEQYRYLWENLAVHLGEAGERERLVALVQELRWVVAKIRVVGPASVEADLALLGAHPVALALARLVRQTANLRETGDQPAAAVATLAAYAAGVEVLAPAARRALRRLPGPALHPVVPPLPDQPDPALLRTLTGPIGHITGLAVAYDGSWLAAGGGANAGDGEGIVVIWNLPAGTDRVLRAGNSGPVSALAAARDGSWLASADRDGTVRIWDVETGRLRHKLTGHTGRVAILVVAPDGSWLASGSAGDRTVRIWDTASGTQRHVLNGGGAWISAMVAGPDGRWLAVGDGDGSLWLWDPATGACTASVQAHGAWVSALAVEPNGSWLASGSYDGTVRMWDPAALPAAGPGVSTTLERRSGAGGPAGPVTLVAAPDGSWLASGGGDGQVRLWDPAHRVARRVLSGHADEVTALVVAPNGSWLASASSDGTIQVADPRAVSDRVLVPGHARPAHALVAAPNGSWLASAGRDGTVRIWEPAAVGAERAEPVGRIRGVSALEAAESAGWLAVGAGDGSLALWDTAGGAASVPLAGHRSSVRALSAPADGRWLASLDGHNVARVWELPDGGQTVLAVAGQPVRVSALLADPRGSWLATGGPDAGVRLWDPVTGAQRTALAGHGQGVLALAAPADGSWLASAGGDATVRVWDPAGTSARVLSGHTSRVQWLAAAPDGSWLASAGIDGTIRIWDIATGGVRLRLGGGSHDVWALAVAPDGSWFASGGADARVRIWEPGGGARPRVLTGHRDGVAALAISPDGAWIASVSPRDHTARIWAPDGSATTMIRLDGALTCCRWTSPTRLAVGGARGLYLFDLAS
jgi:WD40 repeat protein